MSSEKKSREKYVKLLEVAKKASLKAYAPYSNFKVGASILSKDGTSISGCNVENASFGLSNCAERTAVFKAISKGITDFEAIAIYADSKEHITPCGACRQVLAEFNPKMVIICGSNDGTYILKSLDELLPHAFGRKELEN